MPSILVDASHRVGFACALGLCALACDSDGGSPAVSNGGSAGSTPTAGSGGTGAAEGGSTSGGNGAGGGAGSGGSASSGGDTGSGGNAGSGGASTPRACNIADPFSPFTPIAELNTADDDRGARFTSDELTVVFSREGIIYEAQRASRTAPFDTPRAYMAIGNARYGESAPWISDDGLVLFFEIQDLRTIYTSRRQNRNQDFVDSSSETDGSDPYVAGGANGFLYVSRQDEGVWAAPLNAWNPGTFVLVASDWLDRPTVTSDQLTMYVADGPISVSQRATTSDLFETWTRVAFPEPVVSFQPTWLSPDACRLYVDGQLDQGVDLAVYERVPP
jgi:hypothetical protein